MCDYSTYTSKETQNLFHNNNQFYGNFSFIARQCYTVLASFITTEWGKEHSGVSLIILKAMYTVGNY